MTVAALINIDNVPVLISDMMISVGAPGKSIPTPTLGDTGRFSLPFSVVDLRRKIIRPCESCVLSYAGSVETVTDLISDLRKAAPDGVITTEIFETIIYNRDAIKRQDIGIVGYAWDGMKEEGNWFSLNAIEVNTPYFGRCLLIGSGAQALAKWLHALGPEFASMEAPGNPFEQAMDQAHSILSRLINNDSLRLLAEDTPLSIQDYYGGWYEATYMWGPNFRYVKNTALITLTASQEDESCVLNRLYFNSVCATYNKVVCATIEYPIACATTDASVIFTIPQSNFWTYLIKHDTYSLDPVAKPEDIKEGVDALETAICHLQKHFLWTEEEMSRSPMTEDRWDLLGETSSVVQRYIDFDLKFQSGRDMPPRFSFEIDSGNVSVLIDKKWLKSRVEKIVLEKSILLDPTKEI